MPKPFSTIDDALSWLSSHVDYERTAPTRRDVPTLQPVLDALHALGDPQRDVDFVHVTGTNGKGSTTALVSALLTEEGRRVGTFTSPDLHAVNERISVAGNAIDDAGLCQLLGRLRDLEAAQATRLTRFELLTVGALLYFADEGVDAGVVEVGLGGTWDSTNVIDARVAVVTNVSLDHTEVLGHTVEAIATDKAGIVKPGSTAVLGDRTASTIELQSRIAAQRGAAATWRRPTEIDVLRNDLAVGGRLVSITTPLGVHADVHLSLHGRHQGDNAMCALAAAEAFEGVRLGDDVVERAFGTVRVPGRLEVLRTAPLVLLDGAHNPAGMRVLVDALHEEFAVRGATRVVLGVLANKDPDEMLASLATLGDVSVYCCQPDTPRALDAVAVARAATIQGLDAQVHGRVPDAVDAALHDAAADDLVVVTGSFYVVGAARGHLLGYPPAPVLTRPVVPSRAVNRTLVIVKPDGVERGLIGEILGHLERKGLRLVAGELRQIDEVTAGVHYEEHAGKPFYGDLVAFITRSAAFVCVVEGPEDTWAMVRSMMGATNPADAALGTIRGDLATEMTENLIHGSDSAASASREIAVFFPSLG